MTDNRAIKYAKTLSALIQSETVSVSGDNDITKFLEFHKVLKNEFPDLFKSVDCEVIDGSLLLKWNGSDNSLDPVLLMNHHDVVEASGDWKYPPFSGKIADGKVWGRGTLDTKGGLCMMLQAANELVGEGFVPKRDIYFVSTCTEEIGGAGAAAITKILKDRGIHFYMVLDEGGMILYDPIGGAHGTFAMIGVGEKGYVDLKFTAKSLGGHASTPGKNTPLSRLSRFIVEAEKSSVFETKMSPTIQEMLSRFAPKMSGIMKLACGNVRLFKPLLTKIMPSVSPAAAALLRTTLAFTMCKGSDGANVLPQEAWVIGNMRYSHHQGRDESVKAITELAKKYGIETQVIEGGVESGLTDYNSEQFKFIEKAVNSIFPEFTPIPYIMTGASDCRFFNSICDNCIRFVPFNINKQQFGSVHGIDENVDIDCLPSAVDFYKFVIKEV